MPDLYAILTLAGAIVLLLVITFGALLVLSYAVGLLSADHDHEHFDYEDMYPDKADKHHK